MDTLRFFGDAGAPDALWPDDPLDLTGFEHFAEAEAEANACHAPPPAIGQDERRMQVRAYNYWAGLLGEDDFPEIYRLDPQGHPDFGPYSVLLDLSEDHSDPRIVHLGKSLARACGCALGEQSARLSDVPGNSLLTRITDHYSELLANRAPIGFEAEFASGPERLAIYRGILLPFSSNGHEIDHVYGVLNWKELADGDAAGSLPASVELACPVAETETPWGDAVAEPVAERLRSITPAGFDTLSVDGPEFTLLMARRLSSGNVVLLGELPYDRDGVERAAQGL
ncbi:hypothetical protein [Croceicoccus sp. Ery5]|uniref:hypothetical protein n=1 Tax=Croceicoccus sp. Ery5 TaxID=1703340 RepID=UPI001E343A13|nr:hypothetical protein [Croceicoccus sp. Ery5]